MAKRRAKRDAVAFQRLRRAKASAWKRFAQARRPRTARASHPRTNVVGMAIGVKSTAGRYVGRPCVVVLVERKISRELVPDGDRIPPTIDGVETDVVEVGRFRKMAAPPAFPGTVDPLRGGCSVAYRSPSGTCAAPDDCIAGTLGAVVTRASDPGARFLLSNNHVLAGENSLPVGWDILQPGPRDPGPARVVANLADWVKLVTTGANAADCAIAKLREGVAWSPDSMDPRIALAPGGAVAPSVGLVVHKVGRRSGYSVGFVSGIDADIRVDYSLGTLLFRGQMLLRTPDAAFGLEGDSGSLVVDYLTSRPVGLLFATSDEMCAASPIAIVEGLLGIKL